MNVLERLRHDLRHARRALVRAPGFTAVAVLTLALGIGANTAIYSVVHGVVREPLPYPAPQDLVRVYTEFRQPPNVLLDRFWTSPPEFRDLQRGLRGVVRLGAWTVGGTNLSAGDATLRVDTASVSHELWDVLGVAPALGRTFTAEVDVEGGPPAIVLSDGLWRRLFGGRADAVGRTITAGGVSAVVVGVMPRGFAFPPEEAHPPEAWLPLQLPPNPENRGSHFLHVLGRLAPGVPLRQAQTAIDRFVRTQDTGPDTESTPHHFTAAQHFVTARPYHDEVVRGVRPALYTLLAAVGVVLLIACVNVGNLLLARAEVRRHEIALRAALGAPSRRLLEQFVAEGLVLAAAGAALGLPLAWAGLRAILALRPEGLPRADGIGIDLPVLAFTVAISVVAAVVFALAPLGYARGLRLADALRQGGTRVAGSAAGRRARQGLVVAEIALTVVLVIGAGLAIRSFAKLSDVDPGFRPGGLLTLQIDLPGPSYAKPAAVRAFWERFLERARALPGVDGATVVYGLPPVRPPETADLDIEGYDPRPGDPPNVTDFLQVAGPGYTEVMGIGLLSGRSFEEADRVPGAPQVVLVNRAFARRFWPGQDPLGKRVKFFGEAWATVVGVVRDVPNAGLDQPARPEVTYEAYQALEAGILQQGPLDVVVRAQGDPRAVARPLRALVRDLDPLVPVFRVRTMDAVLASSIARPRFVATLLSLFSGIALAMAAVGIYGVVSFQVAQRRRELGVRMALGAPRANVFRLVLGTGLRLALVGVGAGIAGALALTRVVSGLVYGISPLDPPTYAGVAVLLVAVTLLASYVPAAAATRVDPLVALRAE